MTATDNTGRASALGRALGRMGRVRRLVQRLLLLLLAPAALFCLLFVFTPFGEWLMSALIHMDDLEQADYIVVLGGSGERAVEAARLYKDGWAPKVIFSSKPVAAEELADLGGLYGLPHEAVVLEHRSRRTSDHPSGVAALPGIDPAATRLIVITSPFHTSRSRAVFLKAGYRRIIMRSPDWRIGGRFDKVPHPWVRRLHLLTEVLYEVLAWAVYWLRGWV